jgi:hypothetical protein
MSGYGFVADASHHQGEGQLMPEPEDVEAMPGLHEKGWGGRSSLRLKENGGDCRRKRLPRRASRCRRAGTSPRFGSAIARTMYSRQIRLGASPMLQGLEEQPVQDVHIGPLHPHGIEDVRLKEGGDT